MGLVVAEDVEAIIRTFFLWFRIASVKRKSYVSKNMTLLAVLLRAISCVTKKEFFRQCLITSFKKHARRQVFKTSITFSYEISSGQFLK